MKKQLLSTALVSTLVLAPISSILADEVVIGSEPATTVIESTNQSEADVLSITESGTDEGTIIGNNEVTVPTPIADQGGIIVEPSEAAPESNSDTTTTEIGQPLEKETKPEAEDSSASSGILVEEGTENSDKQNEKKDELPISPVGEPSIQSVSVEVKQAELNTGVSSSAAPKPVTVTVIEAPIVTNTGEEIVGTQSGQVLVRSKSGKVEVKAPERVGAVKQSDGTVAIKDNKGKLQVLPSTGEDDAIVVTALGVITLFGTVVYVFRDKVKSIFKK